jgi:hypothetical protein
MWKTYEKFRQYLEEKLLIIGGGKKYGQAVILSGGAGSGKSFATSHFMQGENYKILNVDDLKELMIKISKKSSMLGLSTKTQLLLPQISKMDMKNPEDTAKLHQLMKEFDPKETRIFQILFNPGGVRSYLPNLMFDCTLKSQKDAFEIVGNLRLAGYKPEDIHIVWVLTDYKIALRQNYSRGRRLFNDILIDTHMGAKMTMDDLVFKNYSKLNINGDLAVILGGPSQKYGEMDWQKTGSEMMKSGGQVLPVHLDDKGDPLKPGYMGKRYGETRYAPTEAPPAEWAKDFTYVVLKRSGKSGLDQTALDRMNWFMSLLAPFGSKDDMSKMANAMYPETGKS